MKIENSILKKIFMITITFCLVHFFSTNLFSVEPSEILQNQKQANLLLYYPVQVKRLER